MKKLNKKIICALLLAGCMTAGGIGMMTAQSGDVVASAHSVEFVSDSIQDSYYLNAELTLPTTVTAEYKGETLTLTGGVLYYPNGVAMQSGTYLLDQAGEYVAMYSTKKDGIVLQATKSFTVIEKNWSVGLAKSKVEYGALQVREATSGSAVLSGLKVTLAEGDTFRYNVPIDLSKEKQTEFVTINPLQVANTASAQNIVVRLTDVYDASNYVDFLLWYNPGDSINARAGSGVQGVSGVSVDARTFSDTKPLYIDGVRHLAWFSRYGATLGTGASTGSASGFSWVYDRETQNVYLNHARSKAGGQLVTQMANPDIYEDKVFEGFTTGEVFLSVYAESYYNSEVTFELGRIDGKTGEELQSMDYNDTTAPVLTVDYTPTVGNAVYVAQGEEVELFDSKAMDVSTATTDVSVFYNYESTKRTNVYVKDGKFTAALPGAYTIVYRATDVYGNVAEEKVVVNSVKTESGQAIDFTVEELSALSAGRETALPTPQVEGLNGEVTVETWITDPKGEETLVESAYVPLYLGEYTVTYRYYDAVRAYEYAYTVNGEASDESRFLDTLSMPRYFIKGAKYSLDDLKAYVFTETEPTAVAPAFYVSFDGGEYVLSNVNEFTVSGSTSLQVKYVYEDSLIESPIVPIVDVGFNSFELQVSNYFQGDFTAEERFDRVSYTSNQQQGDQGLRFINTLSFSSFALDFNVPMESPYSNLRITLTDFYNRENSTQFELTTIDGSLAVYVDGVLYKGSGVFADGAVKSLYYNSSIKKFILPNGVSVAYTNEFTSDLCLLDVELLNIMGKATIEISQVCNQPFNSAVAYGDYIEPIVSTVNPAGQRGLNEKIVLSPAVCIDVLSPTLYGKLRLEVTDKDGNYVTSDDGVLLDGTVLGYREYVFTAKSYGDYRVTYYAEDQNSNPVTMSAVVIVADEVAPTVTVSDKTVTVPHEVVYKINNYTVSDNITSTENLMLTIFVMDDKSSVVSVGEEFETKYEGTYTVYIYCEDEAGNSAYATFTVIVSGSNR